MISKTTLLILLSFAFASSGCSFGKRSVTRARRNNEEHSTTVRPDSPTDSNFTVDPHCDCRSSGLGVVRVVPYAACIADSCDMIQVDMSSACVRCSMCMAVAEEINKTLLDIHDMVAPDDWLNETEIIFFLRTICNYSFRHYALREINGKRLISDSLPGDKLVFSSADGSWEKTLRNMCHYYLDEIQELQLYRKWKEWCENEEQLPNLEDILCRNEINNLRDCRGLDTVYRRQVPAKVVGARIKVLAEYI